MKHSKPITLTRRQFVRTSAMTAALAGMARPFSILAAGPSPNEKLNIAAIGISGIAGGVPGKISRQNHLSAVCDVDEVHAAKNLKHYHYNKGVPWFKDYREMFDQLGHELDGVIVSTPDHSHFGPTITALQLGIAAFTQKPLTHTFDQAGRLIAAARSAGVATQMGIQGHSKEPIRNMKEWVEAGLLGEIKEVHTWFFSRKGMRDASGYPEPAPVPPTMAWDLWLGPTPDRPHSPGYYPTSAWRRWLDFGSSIFGDFGTHVLDGPVYVLDLSLPTRIEVETPTLHQYTWPITGKVTFHFPATEKRGALKLHWYGGAETEPLLPKPAELDIPFEDNKDMQTGTFLVGSKRTGMIYGLTCDHAVILPRARMAELKVELPAKTIPRVKGDHFDNFFEGVKDPSKKPCANFDYAGPLTQICQLGATAVRLARPALDFDPAKGEFVGDAEANQYLKGWYTPRKGWEGLA